MSKVLISKGSNVTDARLQKHIRAISGFKVALDSAQGEYRAGLKAAKTDGINTGQLIAAMAAKKRELDEVKTDFRAFMRYMAVLDMPLHQMDMFGGSGGDDPDPEPEQAPASNGDEADEEHQAWKAKEDGQVAGSAGRFKEDNPHHQGTALCVAWHEGWAIGQESLLEKDNGTKRATPRRSREARVN